MKISFVVPSRNNLKYLKWSIDSIRKNQGNHEVWICAADDASTDGTREYFKELAKTDKFFKYIVNDTGKRKGHTILYDQIVEELVKTEVAMIWHADMYLCPGALDEIEKLMYSKRYIIDAENLPTDKTYEGFKSAKEHIDSLNIPHTCLSNPNKKQIVSLTRIEPPLHPPGPEKVLKDFGIEPEDFNESDFLYWYNTSYAPEQHLTEGVFAPWAFFVEDFEEIGGHDPLFAPQSKEDSDIWNRFLLNGCTFTQTWHGCVYHMTCRGSRFNPTLTVPGKNSKEWEIQNEISSRNFIRKWGSFVKHTPSLKPIVPHKYDIAFIVTNVTPSILQLLEPWCSKFYILDEPGYGNLPLQYIETEYDKTKYILAYRVEYLTINDIPTNDILVEFDANKFTQQSFDVIQNLSELITNAGETGIFEYDIFKIRINRLKHYENELILVEK